MKFPSWRCNVGCTGALCPGTVVTWTFELRPLPIVIVQVRKGNPGNGRFFPCVIRAIHQSVDELLGWNAAAVISHVDNQCFRLLILTNVLQSRLFQWHMEEGRNTNIGGSAGLQPAAFCRLLRHFEFRSIDRDFAVAVEGKLELFGKEIRKQEQIMALCRRA
jgi:hypothetical protein